MIKKPRNLQMDILRGIGIILIVLGHSGFPNTHFLYLFHLAIFFIVSGYFFKEDYVKDKECLKHFILNKIKRLYVPFVIGNIICVLLNNFFIDMNLYSDITHTYYTIKEMLINVLKVILFRGHTEMLGATWFLPILFMITVIYAIIEYLIKKYPSKNKSLIQLIVSVLFFGIGYYFSIKEINIKIISLQVLTCYILFDFGRRLSKYEKHIKDNTKAIIMITSFILLVLLNRIGTIELSQQEYTNPIYFICVSILGWYFIYELSYFVSKIEVLKNGLTYIGKNTMTILILHFVAFKVLNAILVLVLKEEIILISKFPIGFKGSYWWIVYTLIGSLVPLVLNGFKKYIVKLIQCKRKGVLNS